MPILILNCYIFCNKKNPQGRIHDFVLGGTKVGEGSGVRVRSPMGPGQSRGRGPEGFRPPLATEF